MQNACKLIWKLLFCHPGQYPFLFRLQLSHLYNRAIIITDMYSNLLISFSQWFCEEGTLTGGLERLRYLLAQCYTAHRTWWWDWSLNLGGGGSHTLCLFIDLGPLSPLLLGFWSPRDRPGGLFFKLFSLVTVPESPWTSRAGAGLTPLFLHILPQPAHFASSFFPALRGRGGSLGRRTVCV